MKELECLIFLLCVTLSFEQQRVAPGVNPQQYQPPPQQYQHVQYQQNIPVPQQVPIQQGAPQQHIPQQQPPVQQYQQQPAPVQHNVPVPQQGHHDHHGGGSQILNAANIAHEREHIQEHLSVPIDTSKMSEQELQFHYFKMHDADNNNKLDGCELIKSLIHWHEQGHKDPMNPNAAPQEKIFGDEELVSLIDPIFNVDDTNRDGFIDYPEFIQAQNKGSPKPSH